MDPIYVIDEKTRQALILIISKGVHPTVAFDQIEAVKRMLEELKPVQVMDEPKVHVKRGYRGPDNDNCGSIDEQPPLEETAPV